MKDLKFTPEDEFNAIIDAIETRAMAADGPVTPTLQEATEEELSRLWELVNEISPKRKALARKIGRIETATTEECKQYLRDEGLDPDEIAKGGVVFVKTVTRNIELTEALKQAKEACGFRLLALLSMCKTLMSGDLMIEEISEHEERIAKAIEAIDKLNL